MTEQEFKIYETIKTPTMKWSIPLVWVRRKMDDCMKKKGNGASPPVVTHYLKEMNAYRNSFKNLYCYDWVCIPLAYTQVAALATYGYFSLCLVGRQFLDPRDQTPGSMVDLYVPIFTIVEFLFFVGWFKVSYLGNCLDYYGMFDSQFCWPFHFHLRSQFSILHITTTSPSHDYYLLIKVCFK